MNVLDKVVTLNEIDSKSVKIIMGEVGSGKTSFHKDMPDVAGGDILYITIGSDKGFNQLKGDKRFKALPTPIKTVYVEKNGKRVAIKERVIPQLVEVLTAFRDDEHDFAGLTIDAVSTIQEEVEEEIKFQKGNNLQYEDWAAIKKAMFAVYELCEEIADQGYEVSLQSHFQIREYEDVYSGEKQTRLLPMMTENNAIRVLKNADAVVMIKLMPDEKDRKVVHRMSIVGGHTSIPTKIRNAYNLSFDRMLFENLTYGGLVKLMQIETLEEAADLDDVILKEESKPINKKKKKKSKSPKKVEEPEVEEIEDDEDEEEVEKPKPKKKSPKKKKPKVEEPEDDEDDEEPVKPKKKPKKKPQPDPEPEEDDEDEDEQPVKKPKKKPKKKRPAVVEEDEDDDEEDEPVKPKKPKKKKPPKKKVLDEEVEDDDDDEEDEEVVKKPGRKAKQQEIVEDDDDDEEDEFEDDDELEDDELFDEDE